MTAKTDHNTPQGLELPRVQPDALFRHVNLAHMRRIDKGVAPRAKAENWPCRDYLVQLAAEREARRKQTLLERCTRSAHFPFLKTIDDFDFSLQSTLRQLLVGSYLGPDFVTEGAL
jgi:DNA replication protein DnaC